jgi:hypothetical protein
LKLYNVQLPHVGYTVTLYNFSWLSWDLATVTFCIDFSLRIVTESPKVEPLLIFSISLMIGNNVYLTAEAGEDRLLPCCEVRAPDSRASNT